ncbi:4217_t:CDS:2 [Ambispora gerdemannii]|uniref:4217_t:CDS:1 n=1 Tax=Ambispora gerdemannii TaxID=144530 RepID=A0A9N9H4K0_9GLOM|nr:4217_t:CDS:2 [Ambispora gerdemannii]
MSNKTTITSLYDQFKNTPKKLKIICGWDEVIQPYKKTNDENRLGNKIGIEYFLYGSKLDTKHCGEGVKEKQPKIKNSPDFYEEAPFLSIAEDLLKLIKEGKVERLIFLSAYDKRKFANGDDRKRKIFRETFAKYVFNLKEKHNINLCTSKIHEFVSLELIPFDSEEKGQSKAD